VIPPAPVVHVGAPDRECRLGLVLDPSPGLSRIRVLYPSIGPTGSLDVEGDVPHVSDQRRVPNPDGSSRWLLAWHTVDECERMAR
jgi:hypothetical protein